MPTRITVISIPTSASKANPFIATIPVNSELIDIVSVTPNPIMIWKSDPSVSQTFTPKYYWLPATTQTLDDTQFFVGAATGPPAATQVQLLVQDMS